MAGIAFKLQKLLSGESYTDLIRAYSYSAVISTGPFLVTMLTLACLRFIIFTQLSIEESQLFLGLVVYVFCFSILGVAPFFYVVTRYLADQYFLKQAQSFVPSLLSVSFIVFALQTLVALPFLAYVPIPLHTKWLFYVLYIAINGIWITMVYVSASKSYLWVVVSFMAGGVVSLGGGWLLGRYFGFIGFVTGFTLGQVLCYFLLLLRVFWDFGYTTFYNFGFLKYFKEHPLLVWIGAFYYLGLWIDKFLFWFTETGHELAPGLYFYENYDAAFFIAFLTIIPSMAFFLVQMETSFVGYYQAYYDAVRRRASLPEIRARRFAMMEDLSHHFQVYAVFQGAISGIIILFRFEWANLLGLNPIQMGIMSIAILGCFLLMAVLMILNVLFYFDFQEDAFWVSVTFCLTNGIFTALSLSIGFASYGFGFTASCFLTAFLGIIKLNQKLKDLDYWTFMRQPILVPQFKFESELVEETPQQVFGTGLPSS